MRTKQLIPSIFTFTLIALCLAAFTVPMNIQAAVGEGVGYLYIDSDEPDGPAFDWVEISGTGTNLGLGDDTYAFPIDLPFTFDFYGTGYNQVAVGSNGGVYFQNNPFTNSNQCIPGDFDIDTFIAVYWDDLAPGYQGLGAVYYEIVGSAPDRKLVVQWENVPRYGSTTRRITAQVQLYENRGGILMLYADPGTDAGSAGTVGIQNDLSTGLQYLCNEKVLSAERAVLFTPEYMPPVLTFKNVITTVDLMPAALAATVTENSDPIQTVTFTLLDDDFEFPAGSDAVLTDPTVDNLFPTATLSTPTFTGGGIDLYKVKLVVDDGLGREGSTQEAIAEVTVYEDACAAQKDDKSGAWEQNYYDVAGVYADASEPDCIVDILDFVEFALVWLDDSGLDTPETYDGGVVWYVPRDILDAKIEAELAINDLDDPNSCSDHPLGDPGVRVNNQYTEASGGQCLSHATPPAFVEYLIDVPASAVGNAVDVWIGHAASNATGSPQISFGTRDDDAFYGTTDILADTGDWGAFTGGFVGQVTFTESGEQMVRFTFLDAPINLDWFTFDWPE